MNLILLQPEEVDAAGKALLVDGRARHLRAVLGVTPGQTVRVGLLDGPRGTAEVVAVDGDAVMLRCAFEAEPPPAAAADLLLAVPRPKVLRRLWAQLAALGVGRILLTNAERVERMYFDTHVLNPEVYEPLLIEGLQQAQDTRLPRVSVHRRLKVLVEDELEALCPDTMRLAAQPRAAPPVRAALRARAGRRVLLAVGPEGGWTDYELRLLGAHGFQPAGLGARTLRTDTACIALLAVTHAELDGG